MRGGLTYSAAAKLIDRGVPPLCLFLHGPEDYLKEDLTRRALEAFLAPGMKSFNFSAYDLSDSPLEEALAAAEAFPALGGSRVIVVRNAQRLSRSKRDRELLKTRLTSPPQSLVILFHAASLDPKSGLLAALPKSISPVLLKSPADSEMDRWLAAKASAMGIEPAPAARRLLLDLTGRSMWQASNELDKLKVNLGERKEVTEEDVLSLVPGSSKRSPFALANAARGSDRRGAAGLALELLERGEAPVALTALISSQTLRSWISCGDRLAPGAPAAEEFRRKILLLCETDSAIKRSKIDPALAAQLMVDALTRPRR